MTYVAKYLIYPPLAALLLVFFAACLVKAVIEKARS